MGDPAAILANPLTATSALAALLLNNTSSQAAAVVYSVLLVLIAFCTIAENSAQTSQLILSAARDYIFSGGAYFSKLHPVFNTPTRIMLVLSVLRVALGTIYVGNLTAHFGLTSAYLVLLCVCLLIPVGLHMVYMGSLDLSYGVWRMPSLLRRPVNIFAFLSYAFLFVAMFIPTSFPVTPQTVNYACVIFGGSAVIVTVSWVLWGRKHYNGPLEVLAGRPVVSAAEAAEKQS
ncbi:hypothetical protein BJX62DRAFT_219657 [Aspergillus germanicus]